MTLSILSSLKISLGFAVTFSFFFLWSYNFYVQLQNYILIVKAMGLNPGVKYQCFSIDCNSQCHATNQSAEKKTSTPTNYRPNKQNGDIMAVMQYPFRFNLPSKIFSKNSMTVSLNGAWEANLFTNIDFGLWTPPSLQMIFGYDVNIYTLQQTNTLFFHLVIPVFPLPGKGEWNTLCNYIVRWWQISFSLFAFARESN